MGLRLVGVELEGGWKHLPKGNLLTPNGVLTHDVSVTMPEGFAVGAGHWGEAVSPPLKASEIEKWIREYHPTHIPKSVNVGTGAEKSCGLHIHVSFDEFWEYRVFVRKAWQDRVLEHFKEWGEKKGLPPSHIFWHRWAGKNRFCTKAFQPHTQMLAKEKGHNRQDRRTQLNYPWGYLRTMEFRMLPMFPDGRKGMDDREEVKKEDVDLAVGGTLSYLHLVKEWLEERKAECERKEFYRGVVVAEGLPSPTHLKDEVVINRKAVI